jgi:MoxR-like ATPase
MLKPAMRHRIAPNYAAQSQNIGSEQLIDMLLEAVPADRVYERPAA